MEIVSRVKSVKEDIDKEISILNNANKEVISIKLSLQEIVRLSEEVGVDPQEILDNGYNGASIFVFDIGNVFGREFAFVSKDYAYVVSSVESMFGGNKKDCNMPSKKGWLSFISRVFDI